MKSPRILHSSRGYCLVDPKGKGVHYGTVHRCLAEYHLRRFKRPFVCDEDVERAKVALKASQWQIRKAYIQVLDAAA